MKNADECVAREGIFELCIDQEHITITVDRFTELVRKEAQFDIVKSIYAVATSYNIKEYLDFLFASMPREVEEDA